MNRLPSNLLTINIKFPMYSNTLNPNFVIKLNNEPSIYIINGLFIFLTYQARDNMGKITLLSLKIFSFPFNTNK